MEKGDILFVKFRYQEVNTLKERPCLVLIVDKEENGGMYGVKITGTERKGRFNYPLDDWKSVGLRKPSYVICNRIEYIGYDDIVKRRGTEEPYKIGHLKDTDYENIYGLCKEYVTELYKKSNRNDVKHNSLDESVEKMLNNLDAKENEKGRR